MQNNRKMVTETIFLSCLSVGLQGLGLLLNIFLTHQLGAATVGEVTLIGSFYSLAAILSGGCGFIAASRFMSEEIGCGGSPHRVYQYITWFCLALSSAAAILLCIFADLPGKLSGQEIFSAQAMFPQFRVAVFQSVGDPGRKDLRELAEFYAITFRQFTENVDRDRDAGVFVMQACVMT